MANNGGYLTLIELLVSYAVWLGIGWLVAGSNGLWVAGVVATLLWVRAIRNAASFSIPEAARVLDERNDTPKEV